MAEESNQRYEFLSPDWIAAFRRYATSKVAPADLAGVDCTVSMEFTDAPPDRTGYYIRVRDGKLEIGDHPIQDADVHAVSDFQFMRNGQSLNMESDRTYMADNADKWRIIGDISPIRNIFIKINIREGFYNHYTA